MSYCVNCGVELDDTAAFCPLCHTPVNNPNQPVDHTSPKPFPTERKEVPPVSRIHLAILLSTVLVSVAVCCGVLNLFLRTQRTWSLYVIGAAVMLWIWLVLPLLRRKKDTLGLQLLADILAIAIYVSFIAVELDGWDWYWHLALPIILLLGAVFLFWGLTMGRGQRSTLSSMALVIGSIGVFLLGVECFVDRYFQGSWTPGWSLVVLAICLILTVPLVVVRRTPSLREEVRRRFHL
ncbi:MAG TPA: zinc-ribbon domain-containing protein [Candidatus Evtepia faecigallinarum]|nr:zinc-ribbon domain-containing protein [Candidatus Evtepia faecigallinarum]